MGNETSQTKPSKGNPSKQGVSQVQLLQQACQQKQPSQRTVSFHGCMNSKAIRVVSSDPHILHQIALFYTQTGKCDISFTPANNSSLGAYSPFELGLNGALKSNSFGLYDWTNIIIDYMHDKYPAYQLMSITKDRGQAHSWEKLYFVPIAAVSHHKAPLTEMPSKSHHMSTAAVQTLFQKKKQSANEEQDESDSSSSQ
mmetsp:Transcript_18104/g.28840  ORF Transcript_18104/g.28840 Transcript_18104/m.28840 type:complete len:198 (-) Transcript_18104:25-618(-)